MKFRFDAAAAVVAVLAGCTACASEPRAGAPATTTTGTTATATPAASETKIRGALTGTVRTDKERARDDARHPAETLSFFGLREDASVLELWPGGGYYTSILAPVVAERGKLTITNFDPNGDPKAYQTKGTIELFARLDKNPEVFGKVARQQIATPNVNFGQAASYDFVFTFRNIHNWIEDGFADKVFAEAFRVLKPGGVLGIEEHRGKPGMTVEAMNKTGYVPEDYVRQLAERAGFRFAARSEINANPKDTTDHPNGVWSLPPSFAGKDVDREKFVAIGESDRMTLRFTKP
ncbi:methyltransferase domain-containing protein [Pendulispora brunnea]|uniref:Methyltransferase domain-containing protein n=1 Tax=Pendulispora brunnea TaxID=2905690 RepID=A0ABZ2K0I4_9BACT